MSLGGGISNGDIHVAQLRRQQRRVAVTPWDYNLAPTMMPPSFLRVKSAFQLEEGHGRVLGAVEFFGQQGYA